MVGTWNKRYLNCIVGSPSGLMGIAEVFWFCEHIMRSESLACFCEDGNVIATANPSKVFYPFNPKLVCAGMREGVTEMDLK